MLNYRQIARSAMRRYLSYSDADSIFEVFRPAQGLHVAPMGVKFVTEEGTEAKFHPYRCNDEGIGPQN